jgi:hypothetical protein
MNPAKLRAALKRFHIRVKTEGDKHYLADPPVRGAYFTVTPGPGGATLRYFDSLMGTVAEAGRPTTVKDSPDAVARVIKDRLTQWNTAILANPRAGSVLLVRDSVQRQMAARVAARYAARDPFQGLSPDLAEALRSLLVDLAFWMGNVNTHHLKKACKAVAKNKELRAWVQRHAVLSSYTLFYGKKAVSPVPEVGQPWMRPEKCQQWSTYEKTARWFAALPQSSDRPGGVTDPIPGGILVKAEASAGQVLLDLDRISILGGKHRQGIKSLMAAGDPSRSVVDLFSGEIYEGEVITVPVQGVVVETG